MDHYAVNERRSVIAGNIKAALDHVRHESATGIEIQARGGVRITGQWATIWNSTVTLLSTVMGISASMTVHIDDVVSVETVWSDTQPPFVAPGRFDAEFRLATVEAVRDVFGSGIVKDAIGDNETLSGHVENIDELDIDRQDTVVQEVFARLPGVLRLTPDSPLRSLSVIDIAGDTSPALQRHLGTLDAEEKRRQLDEISRALLAELAEMLPTVAVEMALEHHSHHIRRSRDPYMPRQELKFMVADYVRQNLARA